LKNKNVEDKRRLKKPYTIGLLKFLSKNLAPSAQPRSGSLQATTSGDLKVAATSAIEIPKQELSSSLRSGQSSEVPKV